MDAEKCRQQFLYFAEGEAKAHSPLYTRLSQGAARDEELLALAGQIPASQPVPLLLFGSVQYLLFGSGPAAAHPLTRYYPSLTSSPAEDDPFPAFQDFCRTYADEIVPLLRSRLVQTNEVRRSAVLLPGFATVLKEVGPDQRLSLIEVGTSAGLNLYWDRYRYEYVSAETGTVVQTWGDPASPVRLRCERRGDAAAVPLPPYPVAIAGRTGLDLNPIDLNKPEEARWLRALIWPEQAERFGLLDSAARMAQQAPPRTLIAGDALAHLADVLEQTPPDSVPCVFHSHAVYQFSREMRERLDTILRKVSAPRPIFRLSLEWTHGKPAPDMHLLRYEGKDSAPEEILLARYHAHGAWIEWLASLP